MDLSIYMSITRDTEFLPEVLERVYDMAHEIVVADGPYAWVEESYAGLGLDWSPKEVIFRGKPLREHSKVRYVTGPWPDQMAKRAAAYEECRGDIVMPLDVDELISVDMESLERFHRSDLWVARVEVANLVRSYAELGRRAAELTQEPPPVRPPLARFFKREQISGMQHLSYLWLMYPGAREQPRRDMIDKESLCGRMAHLTQMRGREGQLVKYLYYRAGFRRAKGAADPILGAGGWSTYPELLEHMSRAEYEELFLRMGLESLRCPLSFSISPYAESDPRVLGITEPLDDVWRDFGTGLDITLPLLPKLPLFFYLRSSRDAATLKISTSGANGIFLLDHVIRFEADNRASGIPKQCRHLGNGVFECRLDPIDDEDVFARLVSLHLPKEAPMARLVSIEEVSPA